MTDRDKRPIALEAYEALAETDAALVDTKPHNAIYERPATLSLLPEGKGKRVLDAGCGPGAYAEWLAERGAKVVAFDVRPPAGSGLRSGTIARTHADAAVRESGPRELREALQDARLSVRAGGKAPREARARLTFPRIEGKLSIPWSRSRSVA